jgi:hypothetical protein
MVTAVLVVAKALAARTEAGQGDGEPEAGQGARSATGACREACLASAAGTAPSSAAGAAPAGAVQPGGESLLPGTPGQTPSDGTTRRDPPTRDRQAPKPAPTLPSLDHISGHAAARMLWPRGVLVTMGVRVRLPFVRPWAVLLCHRLGDGRHGPARVLRCIGEGCRSGASSRDELTRVGAGEAGLVSDPRQRMPAHGVAVADVTGAGALARIALRRPRTG